MCSAYRASSSRPRARAAKACARLHDTSSTMARSSSSMACLKLSSMTSRSRGFSPARMDWIRLLSSASARSPLTSAGPGSRGLTTRNGIVVSPIMPIAANGIVYPVARGASRPTYRRKLHRRIDPRGRLGQPAHRRELHRRIRHPAGRIASPPTAENCTVESDTPPAASASPPTAENCTVESDTPPAASASPPTAENCTVESDTPPAASAQPAHRRNCTVESDTPPAASAGGRRIDLAIAGS